MTNYNLKGLQEELIFCREVGTAAKGIERQADLFAVHLLMPEQMVRNEYTKIKERFSETHLISMADKFCVSQESMKIRLWRELHLIYVDKAGEYYRNKDECLEIHGQKTLF